MGLDAPFWDTYQVQMGTAGVRFRAIAIKLQAKPNDQHCIPCGIGM